MVLAMRAHPKQRFNPAELRQLRQAYIDLLELHQAAVVEGEDFEDAHRLLVEQVFPLAEILRRAGRRSDRRADLLSARGAARPSGDGLPGGDGDPTVPVCATTGPVTTAPMLRREPHGPAAVARPRLVAGCRAWLLATSPGRARVVG